MFTKDVGRPVRPVLAWRAGLALLVIAVLLGGILVPWRAVPVRAETAPLIIAIEDITEPVGLDAVQQMNPSALLVTHQILETLTTYVPGTSTLKPELAKSWTAEMTSAGQVWTFTLQPGVKFSDGTPLTASAVVRNINRWWDKADPKHVDTGWFEGIFYGYKNETNCMLLDVKAVGTDKVQLTLALPYSPLPYALAIPPFGIASPASIDAGTLATKPVGTGPYKLSSWTAGKNIDLVANTPYWGGRVMSSKLSFKIYTYSDPFAALNQVLTDVGDNNTQIIPDLPGGVLQLAPASNPNLRTTWRQADSVGILGISTKTVPALKDVKVRQAIAHALDKSALLSYYDMGTEAADQLIPPGIMGHNATLTDYAFDKTTALSLLSSAGYPDGFTVDLYYPDPKDPNTAFPSYLAYPDYVAQAIQAMLADVKITVNIIAVSPDEMAAKLSAGDAPLFLAGWQMPYLSSAHPGVFFTTFCSAADTPFGPKNAELCDIVLQTAMEDTTTAGQTAAFDNASKIIHDTTAVVPLVFPHNLVVSHKNVANLTPAVMVADNYQNTYIGGSYIYLPITVH